MKTSKLQYSIHKEVLLFYLFVGLAQYKNPPRQNLWKHLLKLGMDLVQEKLELCYYKDEASSFPNYCQKENMPQFYPSRFGK